ncbi:MAG: response regulator transcription factor [Flavobacteriales bacterium]|nr:response regulator transcription factor [Flavobacteriales bacterium]
MAKHSVALIDDHHLMRSGLVNMINGMGDYEVVQEFANGKEFVDALRTTTAPAIAIVDLNMPVMDGYETITWLTTHAPTVLPLALTFDASDDAMVRAVRVGARGFVLKSARPQTLRIALDSLMLTGYYYTESSHELLTRNPEMKTRQEREREGVLANITPREMTFLLLVCSEEEYTYEQIAAHMDVHRRTVDNFRIALFDKFNIKSKTGLVLFALRWGLIQP